MTGRVFRLLAIAIFLALLATPLIQNVSIANDAGTPVSTGDGIDPGTLAADIATPATTDSEPPSTATPWSFEIIKLSGDCLGNVTALLTVAQEAHATLEVLDANTGEVVSTQDVVVSANVDRADFLVTNPINSEQRRYRLRWTEPSGALRETLSDVVSCATPTPGPTETAQGSAPTDVSTPAATSSVNTARTPILSGSIQTSPGTSGDSPANASANAASPEGQPGTMMITVLDDETSTPVSGAVVVVTAGEGQVAAGVAGTNGAFTTGQLPAGDYSIGVSHPGYVDSTDYVRVNAGTSHTVRMDPLSRRGEALTITTLEKGSDAPIGGASVVVRDYYTDIRVASGVTGNDGNFTADRLPRGYYSVHVSHADYFYEEEGVVSVIGAPAAITMHMVPQASGSITILVVDDATGAPIPGVAVSVERSDMGMDVVSVTKSDNGTFTTPPLPAGTYSVEASRWGYYGFSKEVQVGGDTSVTLHLYSAQDASLTVNVVDAATGAPIVGANVVVEEGWDSSRFQIGDGVTNDNGIFTMPTTGGSHRYRVTVTHPKHLGYSENYIQGTGDTTLVVQLEPPANEMGSLNVIVQDVDTDFRVHPPIYNAVVTVREKGTGEVVSVGLTNGAGAFNTQGINTEPLPSGYYTVTVSHPDYASAQWDVFVDGGTDTGVLLKRLVPVGDLVVKNSETGAPIAGATVVVTDGAGAQVASGTTDGDGTMTMPWLPADRFYVTVSHPDYHTVTTDVMYYFDTTTARTVEMESLANDRSYVITVLDDETGEPIAGASVAVVNISSSDVTPGGMHRRELTATGITSSDGTITTPPLPKQSYFVGVARPGYVAVSDYYVSSSGDSSIALRLSPSVGSVTITALDDRTGEPIAGANVVLMRGGSTEEFTGVTDGDGTLTIGPLPTGQYYFVVSHTAYFGNGGRSAIYLGTSQSEDTTVRLSPRGGVLTITALIGDTDIPMAGATVVVVSDWGNGEEVATGILNGSGTFSTTPLPIGGYSVKISHSEYPGVAARNVWVSGNTSSRIHVTSAQTPPTSTPTQSTTPVSTATTEVTATPISTPTSVPTSTTAPANTPTTTATATETSTAPASVVPTSTSAPPTAVPTRTSEPTAEPTKSATGATVVVEIPWGDILNGTIPAGADLCLESAGYQACQPVPSPDGQAAGSDLAQGRVASRNAFAEPRALLRTGTATITFTNVPAGTYAIVLRVPGHDPIRLGSVTAGASGTVTAIISTPDPEPTVTPAQSDQTPTATVTPVPTKDPVTPAASATATGSNSGRATATKTPAHVVSASSLPNTGAGSSGPSMPIAIMLMVAAALLLASAGVVARRR